MTDGTLERALRLAGGLIAADLLVQLASFFWNHPLSFIAFAVIGGGLVVAGVALYAKASYRAKAWQHEVGPSPER